MRQVPGCGQSGRMPHPRVSPMGPTQMDPRNARIARQYAQRAGVSGLPNVFATLGRHQDLFAPYMAFAEKLTPGGTIPRDEAELLVLRTAVNTDCEYEWHHHSRIAQRVGLTEEEIDRVRGGSGTESWSAHRRALLHAADELHTSQCLSDQTWDTLRDRYSEEQMIELCMLVGNYEMLASILKSLRVEIDG